MGWKGWFVGVSSKKLLMQGTQGYKIQGTYSSPQDRGGGYLSVHRSKQLHVPPEATGGAIHRIALSHTILRHKRQHFLLGEGDVQWRPVVRHGGVLFVGGGGEDEDDVSDTREVDAYCAVATGDESVTSEGGTGTEGGRGCQRVSQSINQSVNQSINPSVSPVTKSIYQLVNQSVSS